VASLGLVGQLVAGRGRLRLAAEERHVVLAEAIAVDRRRLSVAALSLDGDEVGVDRPRVRVGFREIGPDVEFGFVVRLVGQLGRGPDVDAGRVVTGQGHVDLGQRRRDGVHRRGRGRGGRGRGGRGSRGPDRSRSRGRAAGHVLLPAPVTERAAVEPPALPDLVRLPQGAGTLGHVPTGRSDLALGIFHVLQDPTHLRVVELEAPILEHEEGGGRSSADLPPGSHVHGRHEVDDLPVETRQLNHGLLGITDLLGGVLPSETAELRVGQVPRFGHVAGVGLGVARFIPAGDAAAVELDLTLGRGQGVDHGLDGQVPRQPELGGDVIAGPAEASLCVLLAGLTGLLPPGTPGLAQVESRHVQGTHDLEGLGWPGECLAVGGVVVPFCFRVGGGVGVAGGDLRPVGEVVDELTAGAELEDEDGHTDDHHQEPGAPDEPLDDRVLARHLLERVEPGEEAAILLPVTTVDGGESVAIHLADLLHLVFPLHLEAFDPRLVGRRGRGRVGVALALERGDGGRGSGVEGAEFGGLGLADLGELTESLLLLLLERDDHGADARATGETALGLVEDALVAGGDLVLDGLLVGRVPGLD